MGLASQLEEAVKRVKLSKTERKILEQAASSRSGSFSATYALGRGYTRRLASGNITGAGGREFRAAESLVKKGLAIEVSRESEREATSGKARDRRFVTLLIQITEAGRKALG